LCLLLFALALRFVLARLRLRHLGFAVELLALLQECECFSTGQAQAPCQILHGVVRAYEGAGAVPVAEERERDVRVGQQR